MPVEPFIGDTKAYASDCGHAKAFLSLDLGSVTRAPPERDARSTGARVFNSNYLCYFMPEAYHGGGDNSK